MFYKLGANVIRHSHCLSSALRSRRRRAATSAVAHAAAPSGLRLLAAVSAPPRGAPSPALRPAPPDAASSAQLSSLPGKRARAAPSPEPLGMVARGANERSEEFSLIGEGDSERQHPARRAAHAAFVLPRRFGPHASGSSSLLLSAVPATRIRPPLSSLPPSTPSRPRAPRRVRPTCRVPPFSGGRPA